MRRMRLTGSDRHATDCSSNDEEENTTPENIVNQIDNDETLVQPLSPESPPRPIHEPIRYRKNPYPGVYLRPSGRWVSEIRTRINRVRLHLGTFDSPEAAYEAYCAKKLELNEKVTSKEIKSRCLPEGYSRKKLELNEKVVPEKNKRSPYQGVHLDRGHWKSELRFRGKRFYVGRFKSAEAAYEAYCAKKRELEEKADLNTEQKEASDEDFDPDNKLRIRKRVKSGDLGDLTWDRGTQIRVGSKVTSEDIKLKGPHEAYSTKVELDEKVVWEKNKKSPYKGVYFDRGHWRSDICFRGNRYYVGSFSSAEAGYQAYCAKKQELEEKADLNKNRKAASDEDIDPDNKLRGAKSGKKVENKKTTLPLVWEGTLGSGEAAWGEKSGLGLNAVKMSGSGFENTFQRYVSSCKTLSGPLDFEVTAWQDPKFHEKPMFGEKTAFKEEENVVDFGCGSIPREMASLIVDENGFLVGEFSQIDDLRMCEIDG